MRISICPMFALLILSLPLRAAQPAPRSVRQDFGYSPTAHAGGQPGEIGGFVTPAAEPAYYAVRLPAATFETPLSASGTLACGERPFHLLVGFFNAGTLKEWRTPNSIALRLNGRGDRFFADVALSFPDLIKTATRTGSFKSIDGGLHTPPEGYVEAGSYKSRDGYGNLQLTFFAATASPPGFKLDADIDDANGVEHVFQVLRHWITDSETHPYDIHQILAQYQGLDTGYRLHA